MENQRGLGKAVLDLGDQVDSEALTTGFISEFDGTVTSADGDGEGVNSGLGHELLRVRP